MANLLYTLICELTLGQYFWKNEINSNIFVSFLLYFKDELLNNLNILLYTVELIKHLHIF